MRMNRRIRRLSLSLSVTFSPVNISLTLSYLIRFHLFWFSYFSVKVKAVYSFYYKLEHNIMQPEFQKTSCTQTRESVENLEK